MTQAFKLPDLGEGIHEGEVIAVRVSEGDAVTEGDILLEVETDKAAVEIPSPFTGVVTEIRVKAGDVVKVGDVLITFDSAKAAIAGRREETAAETPKPGATPRPGKGPVPASPATRKLAREMGVDLSTVAPTGRGGVVTSEDVRSAATGVAKPETAPAKSAFPTEGTPDASPSRSLASEAFALPDFSKWGPVEKIPVRSVRKAIARRMSLAWSRIPHVTSTDTIDVTELEKFRQKHKAAVESQGGRLTLTVFALKAAVTALKAHPRFNASLDEAAGEIILKKYYHIGVAVDTEDGLIVPKIRDVDRKSLTELARELSDLVTLTRTRKLTPDRLQGGTFTLTNMGAMGGGHFTPIIHTPEAAILGLGRARLQPVVREKAPGKTEIVPRLMMPVVLAMDHRVLDGGDAARFLKKIAEALEDPEQMLLTMT